MRVGIAIDSWKLKVFSKFLTRAGFTFEQGEGVVAKTLMLYVETDTIQNLRPLIQKANEEARRVYHLKRR